jgi:arylsulfatase A-like enzyme
MFRNADLPANIRAQDSETPWLTSQTINFMDQTKGPWCAHVSFIKPHWPYIVPAPYHNMYGPEHVPPARCHEAERADPHPVFAAYQSGKVAAAFQRDEVRSKVIPAYMGLIKQCDDQLGRLLDHLEQTDTLKNTMIVLTSDHGDYLGDHWLGEKDLFHEQSVKVPLIIFDPRGSADSTRASTCDALVESIDLAATFVEAAGGKVPDHIIEGRSLLPWLRGEVPAWRDFVISEYDYSVTPHCANLGLEPRDARLFMVFDGRFKLMHAEGGMRPMLFDLHNDPDEFHDLAKGDAHQPQIDRLYGRLAQWGRRMSQRVTKSDADIKAMRGASLGKGILPFLYDGTEVDEKFTTRYRGPARQNHTPDDPS